MKATVEPLEGNKVKVSVEVDEAEFEKAIDDAFKRLAREARIPGFRPGKAPRRVLEARVGAEVGRQQALHDALPEYYAQALREHEVDVIASPELEITEGEESGPVAFEAVVEVRPVIVVPGYASLRVTIDRPEPADEEIDEQIDRLRTQFAELEAVDRPAIEGDFVRIDITGSQDGEEIDQLTAEDYLYELGSGRILPEVDEQLVGAKVGDILTFAAAHPSDDEATLDFRVLVKDVQARVLPELDDEFASEASEFETLDELRDDLRTRLSAVKRMQATMALREETGKALAELVEDEVPEALVSSEMQSRLNDLAMRAQAQGLTLEQMLMMSGQTPEQLSAELRSAAEVSAKVDLALRAVADAEGLDADDDDVTAELEAIAQRLDRSVAEVRRQLERADQMPAVRSDLKKRKAFDFLLERVEIVDPDGNPIERAALELDRDDEAGADEGDEPDPDEPTVGAEQTEEAAE